MNQLVASSSYISLRLLRVVLRGGGSAYHDGKPSLDVRAGGSAVAWTVLDTAGKAMRSGTETQLCLARGNVASERDGGRNKSHACFSTTWKLCVSGEFCID